MGANTLNVDAAALVYNGWTYIPFNMDMNPNVGFVERDNTFNTYIAWFDEHVGDMGWEWVRGDLCARGVLIKDAELATMFKLKFSIK